MMTDLLPINATPAERALSITVSRSLPVVVRQVWSPETCPENILPWLAWALSVDEWDPAWSSEQKRGAIRSSVFVHKRKGTIGAMRAALSGLGLDLSVTEWFQKTPVGDPYTFSIDILVDQNPIGDESAFDRVIRVAESVKNLRSHLEGVNIRGITRATEYIGARVFMGEVVNIQAEPS